MQFAHYADGDGGCAAGGGSSVGYQHGSAASGVEHRVVGRREGCCHSDAGQGAGQGTGGIVEVQRFGGLVPVGSVTRAGEGAGGQLPFLGQSFGHILGPAGGLGSEAAPQLKEAEAALVMRLVVGQGVEDAGGQGGAHHILRGGHRVGDPQEAGGGVRIVISISSGNGIAINGIVGGGGGGGGQARQIGGGYQRVADGFLHPGGGESIPQFVFQPRHRVGLMVGDGRGQHRNRHFIVADDTHHFLNQVLLNSEVAAPVGRVGGQGFRPGAAGGDAQAVQHRRGAGDVQIHTQHLAQAALGEGDGGIGRAARVGVNDAGRRRAAGGLQYQLGGAAQGDGRQIGAQSLFKAQAGVGAEVQIGRRAAVVERVKGGRFQQHCGGGAGDFAVGAAHHAADADGAGRVGNQQVVGVQGALRSVQGGELFAGGGAAHDDVPVGDGVQVEGVQGLVEFQHHIVGDIHHIVDGAQAGAGQAVLQPPGGGADLDAADYRCGVAAAQVWVGDGDLRQGVRRGAVLRVVNGGDAHRLAGEGADFPRHAQDGQAVAPVGG